jgi:tetratricopeptide (TPR) repeat protein
MRPRRRLNRLAATAALATFLLAGCATYSENRREMALAHYKMGEAALQKGKGIEDEMNRRQAYPEFVQALEKYPDDPRFHIGLGNIFLYDRKYDEARKHYGEALRLEPGNPMAHQNLGQLLLATGKYREAIGELDLALANYAYQTPAFAHWNKGRAFVNLEEYAKAVDAFQSALNIIPELEGAWYYLGFCYEKMDRLADAEKALRRALELLPGSAPSHYRLGLVLSRQRKNKEAAEEFRKVLEIDPDGEESKNAKRYLSILQ